MLVVILHKLKKIEKYYVGVYIMCSPITSLITKADKIKLLQTGHYTNSRAIM